MYDINKVLWFFVYLSVATIGTQAIVGMFLCAVALMQYFIYDNINFRIELVVLISGIGLCGGIGLALIFFFSSFGYDE
jgi:type III secretory pathway component EscS